VGGDIELQRGIAYSLVMNTDRYVYWQEDGMWLEYLEEFPDHMTQGATLEELQENLRDICADVVGDKIPGV
jgi:predicted RNase H-like HicB family nuclease